MADAEVSRLNELKINDAETKLMRKELELQGEYTAVKGGDVLTPDYHATYQDKYKQSVQEISDALSTPAQKAAFQQQAKRRAVAFDAHRINYAVGEANQFETTQHQARLSVITDQAASQYANPANIVKANMDLNDELVRWGQKQGITDPAIATAIHKKVNGDFYNSLIDRALTDGDTSSANTLYAAASRFLSDDQKRTMQARIKPANDFSEGQSLAVEAQGMVQAGKPMAEVEMAIAKKATSPGAYNAAQTIFTNLQQANAKAQAEAEGGAMMLYHTSGNPTQAKVKVLSSPEYQHLSPQQQVKVLDYMDADIQQHKAQYRADVQFGWSAETHAEAMKAKREALKFNTPAVMAEFSKIITDPNLKDMSRQEIWAKAATLGPTLVGKVLAEHETLGKQEKPLALDKDILEAAKPSSLKKDTRTANNDAYDGYVKSALLEWQALHPGKRPTAEEQKAIASSANTEYTTTGKLWDSKYKAYEAPPTGRTAGEAEIKRGIIKAAAARGIPLTTEQLDAKYKKYVEAQQ
jgi:hypothetical protein